MSEAFVLGLQGKLTNTLGSARLKKVLKRICPIT